MHEYLRHLETAWFEGSPRVLGIEGNREVLTFIDGDVAVDPQWQPGYGNRLPPYARTDLALRGPADLLRELHSSATGFQPVSPLTDLADAAWTFVPLAPPEQLLESGFDPLPDLPARLRMFVGAYGLIDRKAILPALERSMLTGTADQPRKRRRRRLAALAPRRLDGIRPRTMTRVR